MEEKRGKEAKEPKTKGHKHDNKTNHDEGEGRESECAGGSSEQWKMKVCRGTSQHRLLHLTLGDCEL